MTKIKSILSAKASAELEKEVEKELEIEDPKQEKAQAAIRGNCSNPNCCSKKDIE